jgi:hypothetical protein
MRGRLSRRFLAVLLSGFVTATLGVTLAATASAGTRPVQDPVPIRPNQFFSGFINNSPPGAVVIKVICPGVANTGHPIGRQPVEVKPAPGTGTTDVGFTGSKGTKITASLSFGPAIVILRSFTSYFVKENIPTNITVPCSGTGAVRFSPSPPSSTAKPAILPVTFVNIGA